MTEEEYITHIEKIHKELSNNLHKLSDSQYKQGFNDGIEFMQKKYPELLNKA